MYNVDNFSQMFIFWLPGFLFSKEKCRVQSVKWSLTQISCTDRLHPIITDVWMRTSRYTLVESSSFTDILRLSHKELDSVLVVNIWKYFDGSGGFQNLAGKWFCTFPILTPSLRLRATSTAVTAATWPTSPSCTITVTWSPLVGKTPASCSGWLSRQLQHPASGRPVRDHRPLWLPKRIHSFP